MIASRDTRIGAGGLGRCVVTGAGGFVGARLVAALAAADHPVAAWTRDTVDLADPAAVAAALAAARAGTVFHLAATPPHRIGEGWQAAAAEVAMLAHLIGGLPRGARLIVTGSMAEFGRPGRHDERAPCTPNTAYGFAKHACILHALAMRTLAGADVAVARLFGVYGPGEAPGRLIPHLVARLSAGAPVDLSDGSQVRDFVHVDDVCAVLIALAAHAAPPPLVNVGTGTGVAVRDLCLALATRLGADPALLRFGAVARRAVDEDLLVADTALLAASLGIVPPQRLPGGLDLAGFAAG